jgi:hypothetical protein
MHIPVVLVARELDDPDHLIDPKLLRVRAAVRQARTMGRQTI